MLYMLRGVEETAYWTTAKIGAIRKLTSLTANPKLSRSFFQIFYQIPATCQAPSLRQHVMPLPHLSTGGKSFQAVPVRATKRIPVNAKLSEPVADHLSGGAVRVAKAAVLFDKMHLSALAWPSSILHDRSIIILCKGTVKSVLLEPFKLILLDLK